MTAVGAALLLSQSVMRRGSSVLVQQTAVNIRFLLATFKGAGDFSFGSQTCGTSKKSTLFVEYRECVS